MAIWLHRPPVRSMRAPPRLSKQARRGGAQADRRRGAPAVQAQHAQPHAGVRHPSRERSHDLTFKGSVQRAVAPSESTGAMNTAVGARIRAESPSPDPKPAAYPWACAMAMQRMLQATRLAMACFQFLGVRALKIDADRLGGGRPANIERSIYKSVVKVISPSVPLKMAQHG